MLINNQGFSKVLSICIFDVLVYLMATALSYVLDEGSKTNFR